MMDTFRKFWTTKFEHYKTPAKVRFSIVLPNKELPFVSVALYLHNPLPKITFIIVKKRHNTRFFVREPNPNPNIKMMGNVQPGKHSPSENETLLQSLYLLGTVVDTGIVHPQGFDFYLNSHAAIQGTCSFDKKT
jgi:hypothetical protein